jgi:hypothetical protein
MRCISLYLVAVKILPTLEAPFFCWGGKKIKISMFAFAQTGLSVPDKFIHTPSRRLHAPFQPVIPPHQRPCLRTRKMANH